VVASDLVPPDVPDGLLYPARHDPSRACAALFDRASQALVVEILGGLADRRHERLLAAFFDAYGFGHIG
jgi:hypothetical protein